MISTLNKSSIAKITFFAITSLFPLVSSAQGSKELQACMDKVDLGGMKNSQWTACHTEELKRQDRKLNETYRKVLSKSPTLAKEALTKAQRNWIASRDSWCDFVEALDYAPSGQVNRVACLAEQTEAQEKLLRESLL